MLSDMLRPRLNELGKLKIGGLGEKRTAAGGREWRLPKKYDHFIITTLARDKNGDFEQDTQLMSELIASHGDKDGKLRQIPIVLMSDDPEEVMISAYVWYSGRKCCARSDGNKLTWFVSPPQEGKPSNVLAEPVEEDWNSEWLNAKDSRGNLLFKMHTNFSCVIAAHDARWGGVYKFRTTSVISAEQLYGSLLHIGLLTGGILRGVPMRIVVRPMQVAPNGINSTVYVVHCELRGPDLLTVQQTAITLASAQAKNMRQLEEYRRLLKSPGEGEDAIETANIQQEFHPEDEAAKPSKAADVLNARNGTKENGNVSTRDTKPDDSAERHGVSGEDEGGGGVSASSDSVARATDKETAKQAETSLPVTPEELFSAIMEADNNEEIEAIKIQVNHSRQQIGDEAADELIGIADERIAGTYGKQATTMGDVE